MGLMNRLTSAAQSAVDTIFPCVCPLCRAETQSANLPCPACWREIAFLDGTGCGKCGRPLPGADGSDDLLCDDCLRYPVMWRQGRAVFRYAGAGRRMVLALKHGDRLDLAPMLGGWLRRSGRGLIAQADIIAPIPLHWHRRVRRRYNQAAVLARHLSRIDGAPARFTPRLLNRTRPTESQDGRDRAARATNVAGAFAPGPEIAQATGRRVLLIDDVLTTGATLNEAARTCLEHGVAEVDILVLALVTGREGAYIAPEPNDEEHIDEES